MKILVKTLQWLSLFSRIIVEFSDRVMWFVFLCMFVSCSPCRCLVWFCSCVSVVHLSLLCMHCRSVSKLAYPHTSGMIYSTNGWHGICLSLIDHRKVLFCYHVCRWVLLCRWFDGQHCFSSDSRGCDFIFRRYSAIYKHPITRNQAGEDTD